MIATGLFALSAPASAAPPPPLWTTCFSEEGGSGAGECAHPWGVAADPNVPGHVYVADGANNRVNEFDAWGAFVKSWGWGVRDGSLEAQTCGPAAEPPSAICQGGSEGSGVGQLDRPKGVAVDSAGDIYVVENRNFRVEKFSPAGEFLLMFGGGVNQGGGTPESPGDVCTAAHIENGDTCGAGSQGTAPGQFGAISSAGSYLGIDTKGTLETAADDIVYVGGENRIQEFDTEGAYLGEIALPDEGIVRSLAVDQTSGDLYFSYDSPLVTDPDENFLRSAAQPDVHRLDPESGEAVGEPLEVGIPLAIAADAEGDVYVVDGKAFDSSSQMNPGEHSTRILVFDAAGSQLEILLETGFSKSGAFLPQEFDSAGGIATGRACLSEGADLYLGGRRESGSFLRAWGSPPDDLIGCPRPEVPPSILDQYAVFVDDDTATVRAKIDPRFWGDTTFYVQYGTAACIEEEEEWDGECVQEEPAAPGIRLDPKENVASGEKETPDVVLSDLEPKTSYRYRFVAESGFVLEDTNGPVFGEGGTLEEDGKANGFTTFPTAEPVETHCDNQALREGTPSASLPECRAYEQVSPVDKNGGGVLPAPVIASRDAGAVSFASRGAFAGAPVGAWPNGYGALRSPSGWPIHPMSPPIDPISLVVYTGSLYGASEDTLRQLVGTNAALAPGAKAGAFNLYVHDSTTDTYEFVAEVPGIDPADISLPQREIEFAGASADGSHFYFTVPGGPHRLKTATPQPFPGTERDLYEFSGGELKLVGALGGAFGLRDGSDVGRPSGTGVGQIPAAPAGRAVSVDGSRVYWQGDGDLDEDLDLYLREGGQSKLVAEGGEAEGVDFEYASADGSVAFLTKGGDLYRYEAGSEALTDLTTPAEGKAGVSWVLGTGEEGTYAYFIAKGALAPGAVEGEANLYAWHQGAEGGEETRLIARLDTTAEGVREARVSANGRYLGFLFGGEIDGPHPHSGWPENPASEKPFAQAYLYDHGADTLACASCPPADGPASGLLRGEAGFTGSALGIAEDFVFAADEGLSHNVSDRGELFFHTPARLVRRDHNGEAACPLADLGLKGTAPPTFEFFPPACTDVYRYRDEGLRLLSAADDSGPAFFGDASADGEDVLIVTASQLVGQDEDSDFDLYDAREEGGIIAQNAPEPVRCESPEECRGEGSEQPAEATAATPAIAGVGNLTPATRCKRLARGAVRQARKAKALRKRARHLSRAAKRASRPKAARAARRKVRRLAKAAHKRGKAAKHRSARGKRCRRAARSRR